jgi:hypothetical protein
VTSHGQIFAENSKCVAPGKAFKLASVDPRDAAPFDDKDKTKAKTEKDAEAIDALAGPALCRRQARPAGGAAGYRLFRQGWHGARGVQHLRPHWRHDQSVQGTDAATEMAQDYLWRVHKVAPPRGMIGIFNRSHYEDVLVVKVKGYASPEAIERRYDEINAFEKMLSDNGTRILKFMLHISKDEQAERLKERIEDETKRWKFNPGDLDDRALWDNYMPAYETP